MIILRIRENISDIMMGENGCGKTFIIRKLSELINNGKNKIKILKIHAWIKMILEFLLGLKRIGDNNIIEEAKK